MSFWSFAPAKVNLFLHVTGRRADGYHLLQSLVVFPAVGDVVSAAPADGLSLEISGAFGAVLRAEPDNLILTAARALGAKRGAALRLEKNLPLASGIGGGSADGAAALRVLTRLWAVSAELLEIAFVLGADVPVCVARTAAVMEGVGEVLLPAPWLPCFGILLVNPGVAVATPAVFEARTVGFSPAAALPAGWADAAEMAAALGRLSNDLQDAAVTLQPVIGEVLRELAALPGVLLARMSGSGATCFALLATPDAAAAMAARFGRPGWWCWGGGLYEAGAGDL